MIIGNFTYDPARNTYTGELSTLTVQSRALVFQPNEPKGERSNGRKPPHYRIVSPAKGGDVELGAAWKKHSDEGKEYLSVTLADPALAQSLNCALVSAGDDAEAGFILVWSVRKPKTA